MIKRYFKKIVSVLFYYTTKKSNIFYNKHKGETCYIFGDGISIKSFDLNNFSDKISIVGNYMPFHKDFDKLNAKYCVMSAPFFFSPYFGYKNLKFKKYLYETSKLYKELIKENKQKYFFFHLTNYPFVNFRNAFFHFLKINDKRLNENFITNRINCYTGVLRNSISLAIYMGFSKVYLVGCDYTFDQSQLLHWYEKGIGIKHDISNYESEFFEIASEFIDITTITLNSKSDILDYISYEDYTGQKPSFKENIFLAKKIYLDILSKWEGFDIY